mgnify:CR=1 FL=1
MSKIETPNYSSGVFCWSQECETKYAGMTSNPDLQSSSSAISIDIGMSEEVHEIDNTRPFQVGEVEIVPIRGKHSERFEVTGFRIGPMAYMTDFKHLVEGEIEKLRGVELLVVNALRFKPHDSHFCVDDAVALVNEIKPRRALLTHLSHEIGLHATSRERLPEGVELAWDGMEIEIND